MPNLEAKDFANDITCLTERHTSQGQCESFVEIKHTLLILRQVSDFSSEDPQALETAAISLDHTCELWTAAWRKKG